MLRRPNVPSGPYLSFLVPWIQVARTLPAVPSGTGRPAASRHWIASPASSAPAGMSSTTNTVSVSPSSPSCTHPEHQAFVSA